MYRKNTFWHSVLPLVGSVIGVGIFGLPYVFARSGYLVGLGYIAVLALVNMAVLLAYAEIITKTKGHSRLTGITRKYLGEKWSWVATLLAFGASWGAMIAYVIIGGGFLHTLLEPIFGGGLALYQLAFFTVSAFLLIGGLGFISRLEMFFVIFLLLVLFLISTGSLPHVDIENLKYVNLEYVFSPFGVVLFAFGGLAAIPEMADILGRQKRKLHSAIIVGISSITVIYVLFVTVVVGVSGRLTSQEAISGLGHYVGDWVLITGSIVGLISVFTSFLILGISLMDTMVYDYKWRYMKSWLLVVSVPLAIYLAGARSFISVIGYTGGVLGSLMGILVIYIYIKAKEHSSLPKRSLQFPMWILYISFAVYALGFIITVLGL